MSSGEVRILTLHKGRFEKSTLYKVKKGWKILFKFSPEFLADDDLSLFINYPENGAQFERKKYQNIYSKEDSCVQVTRAGSYHYYVTISKEIVCDGYISVDPDLPHGLQLDSVVCQTVLSKLLGPLHTWKDKLEVAYRSGYNMLHFTPIQRLGHSNSAYSLSDQHKLNTTFTTEGGMEATFEDVRNIVTFLRDDWKMISICDIVLNHTANETPWLLSHPEAAYNLTNSPHLRPAFILDRVVKRLARDIGEGAWVEKGIPKGEVSTGEHIDVCKDLLTNYYLPKVNIPELFLPNIDKTVSEFDEKLRTRSQSETTNTGCNVLKIVQDPLFRRNMSTVDIEAALNRYKDRLKDVSDSEDERLTRCVMEFRDDLQCLVSAKQSEIMGHLMVAVDNITSGSSYQHVDPHGPRNTRVSIREDEELVAPYFTCPDLESLEDEIALCWSTRGSVCMAHNGWVMGDDPLRNFALPGSNVYLRRELVAWGDSVKLRYGDGPEDSPYLWQTMSEYVSEVVRIFDGVRLDNCHSTPLHVASYMLDQARLVRPDLYVCAELFTGSEDSDNVFVNSLGITSLIREAMAAWDSHELGRMVYKYGGATLGSFTCPPGHLPELAPSTAHALFYDWTHDNPSPVEKRSVEDMLSSAGLVSMASCGVGSSRGYDELVPHHIHVVSEDRPYAGWSKVEAVYGDQGMVEARRLLSDLHQRLASEGFSEVFVDQKNRDIVVVTRHCPEDRRSVIMVAHTHFFSGNIVTPSHDLEVRVEGRLHQVLLEAVMVSDPDGEVNKFIQEKDFINGVSNWKAKVNQGDHQGLVKIISDGSDGDSSVRLGLDSLPVGSFVVVEVWPQTRHSEAIGSLSNLDTKALALAVSDLNLQDIQFVLYQSAVEAGGCYNIPQYGDLNYCGLAGLVPILDKMRTHHDLGHPLADNLRDGDWLLDYIVNRLDTLPHAGKLATWLTRVFDELKCLPRYLIPRYFDTCVMHVYSQVLNHSYTLMSPLVSGGSDLVRLLAQGSIIHVARCPSAPLPPLASDLSPPASAPTIAAGLPHFSTGYMRSWGRDTFISLRGLLLVTGRFTEARDIILGYAGTLRHGLIPNLLDGGKNARYNCRDAVWWWLQAILDYISISGDDGDILQCPVVRLYPTDEAEYTTNVTQPLQDVINEALVVHLQGLQFRERNAGKKIDEHMTDPGFTNTIGVDPETGFVFGGNIHNCGTWMDKMGSSERAGNKGVPSTPRDGSPVEIVGLSWSAVSGLAQLGGDVYCHQEIPVFGSLANWADKIRDNFEKYFWIGSKAGAEVEPKPEYVNNVEMYKDSVGSGHGWTDYQLRPNYVVTLAVAPDLCDPGHAWSALTSVVTRLLGPLGLATLDPGDWAYRGNYDNSDQSGDKTVAHGANYHQGPEWVWPVGFLLRALLTVADRLDTDKQEQSVVLVRNVLARLYSHLKTSDWMGLPELTNRGGTLCRDSNPIQAWSMSTVLDTLYDLDKKNVKL